MGICFHRKMRPNRENPMIRKLILICGWKYRKHGSLVSNFHQLMCIMTCFRVALIPCQRFNGYTRNLYIQHHFIITITLGSLKERQAQQDKRTQRFILGNPLGGENQTKLPQYRIQPSTVNNPKNKTSNFLSPADLFTLSLVHLLE